ncbi:acyl dehydratase [Nocardia speluncae]|uniref:Acyl dehydratase n=1 Tax=Nocardia speluncae TaxID=419477 RepID=A0A846XDM1_9NOCA|nr:MaoC/PaaZ C-terminal domain-containing protein [Nocardia speluncae]NKY32796.1 acyl dehydratase [Nocardia speluncae]
MNSPIAANSELRFGTVRVGDRLPEKRHVPTRLQLFRYSAVTWNTHRIHFDSDYAEVEGYPDVLVQSHLHGAFLAQLCTDWIGSRGRLTKLGVTVRRFAVPDDVLVCTGVVTDIERADGDHGVVHIDLNETRESDHVVCAIGAATVSLPL